MRGINALLRILVNLFLQIQGEKVYQLQAVVGHRGTTNNGHYYALAKHGTWYHISDMKVRIVFIHHEIQLLSVCLNWVHLEEQVQKLHKNTKKNA